MSERQPSKKKKSKKGSSNKKNGGASANGSEMVPYDDPEASTTNGRPKRPEQRMSNSNGRNNNNNNDNQYPEDDDMSDVSDAEYTTNNQEEPQFKYSTADLQESSWQNGTCCIIVVCVICIIVAIVLSVVMVKIQDDKANQEPTSAPTAEGTLPPPPAPPGVNAFQRSQASVNQRCSEENFNTDKDTCLETCAGFDCCDPSLPEDQSCLLNNREGCLNYSRCHVTNNQIEPAPSNLHEICSPERLAQDSMECELECFQLECCWSEDLSCISDNFYACLDYAPCQNMRNDFKVVAAPTTLVDLCSDSAGSVTQSGACDDACAPAECCWSESMSDNCLQSDLFACLTYEPCKQLELPPASSNVTAPTADVADVCTATVTETAQGKAVCQDACTNGNCCVEGASDYCFLEDPLGCLPYDSCKNAS